MSTLSMIRLENRNLQLALLTLLISAILAPAHPAAASEESPSTDIVSYALTAALKAEARSEELSLVIDPGLTVRGWRTTFDVPEVLPLKEENHEVDPDPVRCGTVIDLPLKEENHEVDPDPVRCGALPDLPLKEENHEVDPDPAPGRLGPGFSVSVLDVSGEDVDGAPLQSVRILLVPGGESPATFARKEENHEVDPDPFRLAAGASVWQAWIRFPATSQADRQIEFRVLDGLFEPSAGPEGYDALLSWTAAWLWPGAFADEVTRPHDGRFELLTYGLVEANGRQAGSRPAEEGDPMTRSGDGSRVF